MKDKAIQFFKDYGLYAILAFVASFFYFKTKKAKPQNLDASADDVLNDNGVRTGTMADKYKNIALQLAHHLGTKYEWFDPRRWTENDKEVYELLKDLNKTDFKIVSQLYFKTYAVGRNLSADLASMLDKKYYQKLTVK